MNALQKKAFIRAVGVADKFHVIKFGIQAISDLRVKYRNGETTLQLLQRSNRALSKIKSKWGKNMRERIKILFELFPDLEKTYNFIIDFRKIYDAKKCGETVFTTSKIALENWMKQTEKSNISELKNFTYTVKNYKNNILSYFKTGKTNAYAESLNSKLQRFLRENFEIRN